MKKTAYTFLVAILITLSNSLNAQTVVYSEDFDGALTWTLNTDPTAEGSNPNFWYISCEEEGVGSGVCGAPCGAGDQTLHVSTDPALLGDLGAAYFETGIGMTTTNRRAESANISTVGFTNLTLDFDMIGFGGNASDYCEVFYSIDGGASWVSLATPLTAACCGGACDGTLQGLWQTNSYVLPATCENIANLRISFVWRNNDDGIATDPSFAVDNIEITSPTVAPPVASFTASATTICVGDCIDFTNTSTGGPFTATDWTFTGAATATSSANNPTNICYNTAGSFQVALSVTDANGTDVQTTPAFITVVNAPNAGGDGTSNICNNATLDLNTLLSGADAGGTWAETSGTPSGQFTVGTGVLDGNGLGVGNVYTFTYTVSASCGSDVSTFTITVIDCSAGTPPTAAFTPSATTICAGDCITFTDNSTPGDITNWAWDFGGGATPNNFVGQNPGSVCFNTAGTFTVTLGVTNPFGNDLQTATITVNALPTVTASANPSTTVCAGDPVILTGSGASAYAWTGGISDGVSFIPAASGSYTVTGTDVNLCQNTATINISVITCEPMVAGFSYNDNICVGDCITFTDTTTGNPISWSWDFGPDATPTTSTDQNPVVCFNTSGTFNIQLTTTDASAATSSTTNSISVFDLPTVFAENDTATQIGNEVPLMATGSGTGSYLWTPDDNTIDCDTCSSTYASPLVDTKYTVVFTDVNGCSAEDSVLVYINFIEAIDVPQAFSPNGDNNNDILFVKGYGITSLDFKIYNRYGEMVFHTTDQNIGWDGKFKNRDENPGVFVWVLTYTTVENSGNIKTGNTTLIR
ncbi:MAG: gliding motility-associated C-terminal domain-containing protein [Crocinitomicaceae bacterium]|nr:gliding motility-associated C-terminal domain-containing protein [Crocinitomicaceae bacterium]